MPQLSLKRLLSWLLGLFVVIQVGVAVWTVRDSQRSLWLLEKEMNPLVSPYPAVSEAKWCGMLATMEFAQKSENERIHLADQKFAETRNTAYQTGYSLEDLQSWFRHTAMDFRLYPVRDFTYAGGLKEPYRDLRRSGFPRPTYLQSFVRFLSSVDSARLSLVLLPVLAIPLLIFRGAIAAIRDPVLAGRWKVLVGSLVVLLFLAGVAVWWVGRLRVGGGPYNFYDRTDYVSVSGTWTAAASPKHQWQTTKLDCWRTWDYCIEATAVLSPEKYLKVDMIYWPILEWEPERIVLQEDESLPGCYVSRLELDRKIKTVRMTKTARTPKTDDCAGVPEGPLFSELTDGLTPVFRRP